MAYHTRSATSRSSPSESEFSPAEAELIRQQLSEKEKRLNQQAEALAAQQAELITKEQELTKEMNKKTKESEKDPFNMEEMQNFLASVRKELSFISDLPREVRELSTRVNTLQDFTLLTTKPQGQPQQHKSPQSPYKLNQETSSSTNPLLPTNPFSEPSPIRLKDVADSIPRYDGQRMSIYQFSTACERALTLISPNHEQYLVQLILSKLQGHAYTAVEGTHYTSVFQLLQRLKQIFGPNKSLNQYRGELGNAFMKPHESIFDYIARIKEIKTAITDCEAARATSFQCFDEWAIDNIEQEVLQSFINGLSPDLHMRIRLEGYHGLDDAIVKAIQISKAMEAERIRSRPPLPNRPAPFMTPSTQPYNSKPAFPPDMQPRNILQRPQQPYIKPLIPGQPGPNSPSSFICKYCKTPGHTISHCRKLAYRRSLEAEQGSSSQMRDISGNEPRVPTMSDVHRDAEQTGRQVRKTVHFEETTQKSPESQR